jgi:hypothetical protein
MMLSVLALMGCPPAPTLGRQGPCPDLDGVACSRRDGVGSYQCDCCGNVWSCGGGGSYGEGRLSYSGRDCDCITLEGNDDWDHPECDVGDDSAER